jgi:tRNA modification GTPase
LTNTVAACLTPPGTGAIATVGIRGPSAWEIARGLYRPLSPAGKGLPEAPQPRSVWLGRFGAEAADEVVLTVKEDGPSVWVEVHCHGGTEVVRMMLESLVRRGARVCGVGEFFTSPSCGDPLQHLAAARLLRAPTARTAAILLDQSYGAFRRALGGGAESIARLARLAPVGRHLVEPWKVVLAGVPNVGKSSLLNALAGYHRSIVAPAPGTTRDVVTTTVALDGWPVELADTAGLRQHTGALEGQGIERARGAAASADLCVWVLDASAEPVWPDLPPGRVLLVVNKIDLAPAWDLGRAAGAAHVSARTGAGLPELCGAVVRRLVPDAPAPGEAVPFTPALCDAVEEAHAHLAAGRTDDARRVLSGLVEPSGGPRP